MCVVVERVGERERGERERDMYESGFGKADVQL